MDNEKIERETVRKPDIDELIFGDKDLEPSER